MPALVPWLLLLHVLGAIVAFGPTFVFPLVGGMVAREPSVAPFVSRMNVAIVSRLVVPAALSLPVTGLLLVWAGGWDVLANRWLALAIVLYVLGLTVSLGVALPNARRIVALANPPAARQAPGAEVSHGPPPELRERIARSRRIGLVQMLIFLAILFLMVVKPAL
ncbi:MAG TPA: DUF2269 family protein [Candidatus Limnocylindrales bacterium]|nr:DUF2269 family protein [Candidatus Limnocylindrales bacterium]